MSQSEHSFYAGGDELSAVAAQRLVAYEQAKAGDRVASPAVPASDELQQQLAKNLECVDLLHRVWPDFDGIPDGRINELPFKELGDFRIVREIGSGGMGTVYEAVQQSMGRRVALKVLPFAALVHDRSLQRFRNEVRAAAALDHPHIVAVYSIGDERGVHFYAMQLVRGQTLADLIAQLRSERDQLSDSSRENSSTSSTQTRIEHSSTIAAKREPGAASVPATKGDDSARASTSANSRHAIELHRFVARLGSEAADALQHAHEQGVQHRDIKPSNLLLDREGKLYVTDFGLARIQADDGLTRTGDVVGTLRYMPPEQALAKRVVIDNRADVYSLGATLYELLALVPAFGETDRAELLKQIAFEEPRSLRKLDRRIPVDLETIVLKAMAKDPDDRYQTAQQLADDLRRFLTSQPIKARPASYSDRVWKWGQRHRAIVRTAGVAVALLIATLAASMARIRHAQTQTMAALDATSDMLYTSDVTVAYQTYEKGLSDQVQTILDRQRPTGRAPDRRGLEWYLLQELAKPPTSFTLAGHEGSVCELAVFPDRRRLASVGADGTLRIWDLDTRELMQTYNVCDTKLESIAISPDGRFAAVGSNVVYIIDLANAGEMKELYRSEFTIESLAFSPDGQHVAAGVRYEEVCLLSLNGQVEKRIPNSARVQSLEYLPGTSLLLVPNRRTMPDQSMVGFAQVWREDLETVEQEIDRSKDGDAGGITIARSSPCGKFVAGGETYHPRCYLFERASGRILGVTRASRDRLTDLAFSPDSQAIAIGYRDGRIEYFPLQMDVDGNTSLSRQPLTVDSHRGELMSVKFVDSQTLASCGTDGLIRIWNLPNNTSLGSDLYDSYMNRLVLSPDGKRIVFACHDEYLIVDSDRGNVVFRGGTPVNYIDAAWSAAGDRGAVLPSASTTVPVFDRDGKPICSIDAGEIPIAIAFAPIADLVGIVGERHLQLRNPNTGREIFRHPLSSPGISIAFSSDGQRLAYGLRSGPVVVFDIAERKPVGELACGSDGNCLAFSHDGSLLAMGNADSNLRIWEVETGRLRAELLGHERAVQEVVFSPDDRTLFSTSSDGSFRLWSVNHGRGYGSVTQRPGFLGYCRLSLSSDGRRLAFAYGKQHEGSPDLFLWTIGRSDTD